MNESESLGLHSYDEPRDPLSAREAAGEARREQFSLEEREAMSAVARIASIPVIDKREAYLRGYDRGKNGANTHNCHFAIFSSQDNTRAWERGSADGEANLPPIK